MTNLLPLATWFEIMGFDPWHAAGVAGTTTDLAITTGCDTLIRRYNWQNSDAASQVEIMQAIEQAEQKISDYLKYSVAPHYVSETLAWPPRPDGLIRTGAWGSDNRWLSVQLQEGYVRAVGIESLTAISTGAAVVYSDVDGDTIDDTFTVGPIATSITDATQIAAYFSVGDRFNAFGATTAIGDRWRIQPIRAVISGGNVTITGPKYLLVKPIKYEGRTNIGANGLEPATVANFVTTLDVYQRTTSTGGTTADTSQALIIWETRPCHGWWCCCTSCVAASTAYSGSPYDPAATAQAVARVGIRDAIHGVVTPAEASYDTTTATWASLDWTVCTQPDRVTVRYLAGYPLAPDGLMAEPYRTMVARMAAAELGRSVCGCEEANRQIAYWQLDLAQTARSDELYAVSQDNLNNPLGTRRGQVYAWKQIINAQTLTGILG